MINYELDLISWHTNRFLDFKPKHFVLAKTPVTSESSNWIYTKLRGRFCYVSDNSLNDDDAWSFLNEQYPAFEDPQEAVLYELTWS